MGSGICGRCTKNYKLTRQDDNTFCCISKNQSWITGIIGVLVIFIIGSLLAFCVSLVACKQRKGVCCKKKRGYNRPTADSSQDNYVLHENINQANSIQPQIPITNQLTMDQPQ